jgi:hypothetical protein
MTHKKLTTIVTLLLGLSALATCALAQVENEAAPASLGFTGARFNIGMVIPDNASTGLSYGVLVGLGSLYKPWMKFSVGVSHWSTDIDRSAFGSDVAGSLSDTSLHAQLRWDAFEVMALQPYVLTGIAMHRVGADIPADPSLEDAIKGGKVGAELGIGISGTASSGLRIGTEIRREFVEDVDNWRFNVGVGWWR